MDWRAIIRFTIFCLGLMLGVSPTAQAAKEAKVAHRFQVFVPPNNDNVGRYSATVITAAVGDSGSPTLVDLIDDGADGDDDDTALGISLEAGQSYVAYIRDGAVNDDADGKWDGDSMADDFEILGDDKPSLDPNMKLENPDTRGCGCRVRSDAQRESFSMLGLLIVFCFCVSRIFVRLRLIGKPQRVDQGPRDQVLRSN